MRRMFVAALCGLLMARSEATGQTTRLRIIATNDFHGALEPRPDPSGRMRGGGAAIAGAIKAAQAECALPDCAVILLDAGDEFQGTPASNFAHGRPVIDMFNHIGLSAAALGNHEFDWTQDTLRAMMALAHYPIMGANVRFADGRDVPWIPDDTIIRRGRVAVGVIGISTQSTPVTTMPANVANLRFVDPVPVIDSIAPLLRARGAQVVIVVAHAGGNCVATVCLGEILDIAQRLSVPIDAIVAGHSHTLINTVVRGTPIVEARSRGQAIDVVDLAVGTPSTTIRHEVREVYSDSVTPDPAVQAIVRQAVARVAPMVERRVATIAEPMPISGHQFALGNLIADAMRVVGHGDIGLMNNGGVRQSLPAGVATYGTLFEIQPFANTLFRVRVRGADLRAFFARVLSHGSPNFHISGAHVFYHLLPAPGIDAITIAGRPIDDAAIYTIVQSDFTATGGDGLGFGATALSTEPVQMVDLDALIQYLKDSPQPVRAPTDDRLTVRP